MSSSRAEGAVRGQAAVFRFIAGELYGPTVEIEGPYQKVPGA